VLLYRIAKSKYIRDLSGEGSNRGGGRWNYKGVPLIYTADSTALATLETLVHSPLHLIPKNIAIAILELPDSLEVTKIESNDLPDEWWSYPAPIALAEIGNGWSQQQSTVALSVPSSVTPFGEGRNYLLNPLHPNFNQISIVSVEKYIYDYRLFLEK
jgi:RES domain-containing protein